MPAGDEYAAASGAGKLKLKSSKVSDGSRVEKKKKKKKQQQQQHQQLEGEGIEDTTTAVTTVGHPDGANDEEVSTTTLSGAGAEAGIKAVSSRDNEEEDVAGDATGAGVGKTEAERKYEEVRRKRRQERLKREGVKSHKERVEELNKYLSRLSEHHDMPRIGPG